MKFRKQLDQFFGKAPLAGPIAAAAPQDKLRSGAVLGLMLIMAVFAMPGTVTKLKSMKEMIVPAEDVAALGRHEIAKNIGERLYWGRLVAAENPSLTRFEINEIGRAILKYSEKYGLPPEVVVAIIKVESSGRIKAVSPQGAQGLMQVMPFWKDELGIEGTLFDIDNNIKAGTHILSQYIEKHGHREGIARYYRGSLPVSGEEYYGKVQKAMRT